MALKKAVRFLFKLVLIIAVLLIGVFILFESGIGGRYVLAFASNRTGLEITADRLRVGLDGRIRLRQLSVTLPEEETPFFTAHYIGVSMNSVGELIRTRGADIRRVRVVAPSLTLRRNADGRLNIAPLLAVFEDRPERPQRTGSIRIPTIAVTNGSFAYFRPGKAPLQISGVNFTSRATRGQTLELALTLPGDNTIEGVVDLKTLSHSLHIAIEDIAALPVEVPAPTGGLPTLRGQWNGEVVSRQPWKVQGQVIIEHITLDEATAACTARIVIDSDTVTAYPEQFELDPWGWMSQPARRPEPVRGHGGMLVYELAAGQLTIEGVSATLLDGQIAMDAVLLPRQLDKSRGTIVLENLDLAVWVEQTAIEEVFVSGSLRIEPAEDRRAMEPMKLVMQATLGGWLFEKVELEEITAEGYLGSTRLVTTQANIPIFGGRILPWVSLTRRDSGVFIHTISEFQQFDLDRIVRTFTDEDKPVPGMLNGTVRCRTLGNLQTLSGNAEINLTESDLINTNIIGALHGAMNLSVGRVDPKGSGTLELSAHGDRIEVTSFEYFNRGVEVRGAGAVESALLGRHSPVSGFATGSMRPLRDTRLPGTRELDKLIGGLQAGLTTVRVEGTLGDPNARVVPMPEVQGAIRALFWEQLRD